MPFAYDELNLETSVAAHDAEAIADGSTEADVARVQQALSEHQVPAGPLLDIGCGSGRHVRALAAAGYSIIGIDADPSMLAAAQAAGVPPNCQLLEADASNLQLDQPISAALLLNRGLTCFHSHRLAWGLFASVSASLRPGGLFLIDNPCLQLWGEVANGHYGNGIASDNSEQMFFLPGENRFVWRRGDAVDVDSWTPKATDRLYRLWSLNEVALAAAGARLELLQVSADADLIILRAPVD